jgi:hypothetical protein
MLTYADVCSTLLESEKKVLLNQAKHELARKVTYADVC